MQRLTVETIKGRTVLQDNMAAKNDLKHIDVSGKRGPERTVKGEDVYRHMAENDPLVTAKGLADELEVSHVTTRARLEELAEHGYIRRRRLHATTTAYWHPEALAGEL